MPEASPAASSTGGPPIRRRKATSPAAKFSPDGGGGGEGDGRRHVRLAAEGGDEAGDHLRHVGDAAEQDGDPESAAGRFVGLSMMCYTLGKAERTCRGERQARGLIGNLLY